MIYPGDANAVSPYYGMKSSITAQLGILLIERVVEASTQETKFIPFFRGA